MRLLKFEGGDVEEYRKMAAEKAAAEKEKEMAGSAFVIYPEEELKKQKSMRKGPELLPESERDDVLRKYTHHLPDNVYIGLLFLNDRADFSGGDLIVNKIPHVQEHQVESADEDEDDDEDEAKMSGEVRDPNRLKYSNLSRMTPEKASLVLIQAKYAFGFRQLNAGVRNVLMIEYWNFQHAPIGKTRLAIEEAQQRHKEL